MTNIKLHSQSTGLPYGHVESISPLSRRENQEGTWFQARQLSSVQPPSVVLHSILGASWSSRSAACLPAHWALFATVSTNGAQTGPGHPAAKVRGARTTGCRTPSFVLDYSYWELHLIPIDTVASHQVSASTDMFVLLTAVYPLKHSGSTYTIFFNIKDTDFTYPHQNVINTHIIDTIYRNKRLISCSCRTTYITLMKRLTLENLLLWQPEMKRWEWYSSSSC